MKTCVVAAGLVVILVGLSRWTTAVKLPVPPPSCDSSELPGESLNQVANDPEAKCEDKAAAIFALFKQYINPGDSLQQVRQVLRNTGWVKEAKLYCCMVIGGWIPVDMNSEDRTYSLHLFADKQGSSKWVIYFQLAGESEWGKWNEDGIAFLRGNAGSRGESKIKEFALCYPDGNIDFFGARYRGRLTTRCSTQLAP